MVFALVLLVALLGYLSIPEPEASKSRGSKTTPVRVLDVTEQALPLVVEGLGTTRANEAVVITAQETDFVSEILFQDGEHVSANQLLLKLNSREEAARVHELQINLQEAKRQLVRIQDLARENATSKQLLDEQQANADALEAQLEVAKAQLADREVRAPFAGVLGIRNVSVGALIRPGDQITTLDDLHLIKIDFSIAEAHLPSVVVGQEVEARSVAYPDMVFEGKILSIGSRVDPATRSVPILAGISNPDFKLRPGMFLQVIVEKRVVNALVIPETALVPVDDKQFVYVINADSKAEQREVVIGERKPGLIQIVQGLNQGERVVVEGTLRLQDGSDVKILED